MLENYFSVNSYYAEKFFIRSGLTGSAPRLGSFNDVVINLIKALRS